MEPTPQYIPGTCNIGPAEIKKRGNSAIFSFISIVILIVLLLGIHADRIWRLTLFIPVTAFAVGFQQWYFKFCVAFGWKGLFNFGDVGKSDTVEQAEFRKKDRAKALKIISIAIAAGSIAAITFYYLPV